MKNISLLLIFVIITLYAHAQKYELKSPNSKNTVKISVNETIQYTVLHNEIELIKSSGINIHLENSPTLGENPVIVNVEKKAVNNKLKPAIKVVSSTVDEIYNELKINFKNNYSLIFRAYNEGIAYRFETRFSDDLIILNESVQINTNQESHVYFPKERSFLSMNEVPYLYQKVEDIKEHELGSLPLLFRHNSGNFFLFTESDLDDYPGLWFEMDSLRRFSGTFPKVPVKLKNNGVCWDGLVVEKRADYIAKTKGSRSFPWRAILIAEQEKDLIANQLVYLLAKPAEEEDYSWIEPGMATLDWWGRRNLFNVDFEGGVNTKTFKYFIDFNSRYGIPYFVFDDGWTDECDIYKTNENLNLKEIFDYASAKDVGIMLWINAHVLEKDVKGILDYFSGLGAKGIKVDFFNRDDQKMINLYHEIAREAKDRKLIVDFHGACKPTGLIRTYPNVLTSEGLIEFEQNGISDNVNPILDNTLPFIRMVAGPMDYLPGTVTNAQKKEFKQDVDHPMGLGTRAHSMALTVLFESPVTMLPDSPSDYFREKECTEFISGVPVVWDETKVIDAKIGEYVIIARRNGDNWFLGAITNWESRCFNINLDFLGDANYKCTIFKDGLNSNTRAIDYQKEEVEVTKNYVVKMSLSQGGGWVAKISPEGN